jgi:replicative DNA helicase
MTMTAVSTELLPPQNLEAERSVLGSCLIDGEAISRVLEILSTPTYFYRQAHQVIFEAMVRLNERGEPIDLLTLSNELERLGKFDFVGGSSYLMELLEVVPTAANVDYYARIVRERAVRRDLISAGTSIVQMAHESSDDIEQIVDRSEQAVFAVANQQATTDFVHLKDVLHRTFERFESIYEGSANVVGIPTGFRDLDAMTGGLQRANLIIIGARPSMGKTAFAMNICQNVALNQKMSVGVFSMEMSKEELGARILCSEAQIESERIKTGHIHDSDWRRLAKVMNFMSEAPMYIDDSGGLSVHEIAARARRLHKNHGLDMIMIDYIQLIRGSSKNDANRTYELAEISRSLKFLCKELNIPVIVLSQLSRSLESRTDKRPILSDLRESGAIEQEADLVMFIYRDEYYEREHTEKPGIAEIIIAKQRSGPTGKCELHFHKQWVKFGNLDRYHSE